MEAHPDHQAPGQVLMPGLGGDERRLVFGSRTGGVMTVPYKISLHLGGIDAFATRRRFQGRAEHAGPLAVEFDQLFGNGMSFRRVGVQDLRCAPTPQDGRQFPTAVESVLHGHVHSLSSFRAVCMARIAGNENARQATAGLVFGHVVKLVAQSLSDFVYGPPGHLLHVERKGTEDALCSRDQPVNGNLLAGNPLIRLELVEFDVDAKEVASFTRDQQDVALVGGLYEALHAHVGEVGDRKDVHHTPGLIGRVPVQSAPKALTHGATRPVATYNVPGPNRLYLTQTGTPAGCVRYSYVPRIDALEPDCHWVRPAFVGGGE